MQSNNAIFPKRPDWAAILLAVLMVVWLLALLCGCTTQRKAVRYFDNHGFQGAAYCASRYPVDSFFRPGKVVRDTTVEYRKGLTITLPILGKIPFNFHTSVACPPGLIQTIRERVVDTLGLADAAKIKALQGQNATKDEKITQLSTKLERVQNGRNTWRWIGLCTIGVLTAGVIGWIAGKTKIL